MSDLMTVVKKELYEMVGPSKTRNQAITSVVIFLVLVDFFMPAVVVREYQVSLFQLLGYTFFIAVFIPILMTADMVAGERERHTLETLLSTRLPNRIIAGGKLAAVLIASITLSTFFITQGLLVISLLYGRWDFTGPFLIIAPVAIVVGLLLAASLGSLGILVSSRSQTVQGAQQAIGLLMMPMVFVFFAGPAFLGFVATDGKIAQLVADPSPTTILVFAAAVVGGLVGLTLIMIWLLFSRFQRPRLMAV